MTWHMTDHETWYFCILSHYYNKVLLLSAHCTRCDSLIAYNNTAYKIYFLIITT